MIFCLTGLQLNVGIAAIVAIVLASVAVTIASFKAGLSR